MTASVTRCSRCKRPLRSGHQIGRACAAKERAEQQEKALRIAVAPFSDQQVKDATALIAAGKLSPRGDREGAWLATSRDGKRTYFAHAAGCTCLAGQHGRYCLHMAAVALVEAYQEVA